MAKAVLITYNEIPGVPIGRTVIGNVTVYSGDYGRDGHLYQTMFDAAKALLNDLEGFISNQKVLSSMAENELKKVSGNINIDDLEKAEKIVIYTGLQAIKGATELAKCIKALDKNILLLACDCKKEKKEQIAKQLGIEIIFTGECGGQSSCRKFIEDWNKLSDS